MQFIDEAKIYLKAGDGGNGVVAFHHEKNVPKGGPDGGTGGNGGDIIFTTDSSMTTLLDFFYKSHYEASRGRHGEGSNRTGRNGENLEVRVPAGAVIKDEQGRIIADLSVHGARFVACKGGRGGRGNSSFANSVRQSPKMAEKGETGETRVVYLELRLIADVGLVGMPNAGKSTLISVISSAKPKIADYPFTTLAPNLGVVSIGEGKGFVVADIPGLIEGSHKGAGLGHKFLRHVQRTKLLVHVVDLFSADPVEDYKAITEELKLFDAELPNKHKIIALNKIDLFSDVKEIEKYEKTFLKFGHKIFLISGATGKGTKELIRHIGSVLPKIPEVTFADKIEKYQETSDDKIRIMRVSKGFRIFNREVERLAQMTDVTNPDAIRFLQGNLEKTGLFKELKSFGARDGDRVFIDDFEFNYIED